MTQQQIESNAQYIKALARAKAENLMIGAYGTIKATNQFFYGVTSSKHDGTLYVVLVEGNQLRCQCKAAQAGRYCDHRAVVTEHVMRQASERRMLSEVISSDNPQPMPTRNAGPRLYR